MSYLPNISKWQYQNLLELTSDGSDIYEYKSSKISIAASAFWNSGGGIFIAGIDDSGKVDGGMPSENGKQSIRDWVDNSIKQTEPYGEYEIQTNKLPRSKTTGYSPKGTPQGAGNKTPMA